MTRVLAIATNNAADINGKKTGLWLSELTHFLDVIVEAGFTYDLASPLGGKIPLDERSLDALQSDPINARFMADPAFVESLERSMKCADVDAARYDAIFLSGGHGTMFDFRQSGDLQRVITALAGAGRYLTGVCHGVAGFIDAVDPSGAVIVKGKRVTGFSNVEDTLAGAKSSLPYLLEDELEKSGADYHKNLLPFTSRVEVDGTLITGQNPQSAKAVGEKLVEQLRATR
ncbi:MAG: type 1 glutamine amidotransferase domain-containing protein [Deltaproteobacteria bacterium]|nr:type 1 glutamine amidotransferase domain-containing protein [Myxococcales bacterium]MDP3213279.1 type 1 glutamine amidotransferase domain-containing protein [Deltaproteobacteria bacterium]